MTRGSGASPRPTGPGMQRRRRWRPRRRAEHGVYGSRTSKMLARSRLGYLRTRPTNGWSSAQAHSGINTDRAPPREGPHTTPRHLWKKLCRGERSLMKDHHNMLIGIKLLNYATRHAQIRSEVPSRTARSIANSISTGQGPHRVSTALSTAVAAACAETSGPGQDLKTPCVRPGSVDSCTPIGPGQHVRVLQPPLRGVLRRQHRR
mmetsp:Transcript_15058/g.44960  ORF Transcript_15058/g.44960 Transcript_15058/m.44960 type:complete len:205 (+) Transcript_15058:427-1041(+)